MTAMQCEGLLARAKAAHAQQRATDAGTRTLTTRGESVVETLAREAEEIRRHFGQLKTVQINVLWLCWSSGHEA